MTPRELEVVRLVMLGLSCREAAARLGRSPRTIENHIRSVYRKWEVRNRVELMRAAGERAMRLDSPAARQPVRPIGEIELKGRALELIQRINARLAQTEECGFFGTLCLALADAFGVRWAGISEITTESEMLDIIASAADGRIAEFVRCPRRGSPCEVVINEGQCAVWDGLAERFPDDPLVVELGARAYVGVRLDAVHLGPVGTLWILADRAIDPSQLPLQVLRVIAPMVAAELALAKTLDRLGLHPDLGAVASVE
ncbi:MAG: helix-turn-helix transcriptional regulator [Phycisphaerales bacterium]|nr:helix-turn-helix transcriptional regulator [Phycisphaerales bacterium]